MSDSNFQEWIKGLAVRIPVLAPNACLLGLQGSVERRETVLLQLELPGAEKLFEQEFKLCCINNVYW